MYRTESNYRPRLQSSFLPIMMAILLLVSCRKDAPYDPGIERPGVADSTNKGGQIKGLYVLSEGNMGSSSSSLDFYDFEKDTMYLNVFNKANPTIVKGLGDVGNDLGIYGSKLYIVVNNSNKIEVTDARTVKSIKTIQLNQCRYIVFHKGFAYATSNDGFVAVIDTATLEITEKINVGRNPETMAIAGSKLYVANSGGYSPPNYDSTLSVIDLNTHKEIKKIPVAINLHHVIYDGDAHLYVTSRGDYYTTPSSLFLVDINSEKTVKDFKIGAANITRHRDSMYLYKNEYSYITGDWQTSYSLINSRNLKVQDGFIADGTEKKIFTPYGIIVHPENGNIFVTDAKDYVTPGTLYCFSPKGTKMWSVTTGDIPGHFAFLNKRK